MTSCLTFLTRIHVHKMNVSVGLLHRNCLTKSESTWNGKFVKSKLHSLTTNRCTLSLQRKNFKIFQPHLPAFNNRSDLATECRQNTCEQFLVAIHISYGIVRIWKMYMSNVHLKIRGKILC